MMLSSWQVSGIPVLAGIENLHTETSSEPQKDL